MRSPGPPSLRELTNFDVRDKEYRVLMTQLRCNCDSSILALCPNGLYPNSLLRRSWLFALNEFDHIKSKTHTEVAVTLSVCTITDVTISHIRDVLSETSPRAIRTCMRLYSLVDNIYQAPVERAGNQMMSMTARLSITRIGNWNKPLEAVEAEIRYRLARYFDIVDCEQIKSSLCI